MKNKKIFSLSRALITENLKMSWYLPALSFIAYFMAGILPLLMRSDLLTDPNQTFVEDSLKNLNLFFCLLLVAVPLIAAVMMMGFMHRPARAMAIHAQPFSRNRIYCSHILTGWLMCVLPVAVMTLLYLIIAGMPGASLYWGLCSLAILTFFYGLFVLAGSLVGNSVMQVLLSGVFFGIVPIVIWLICCYCESFLNGFYTIPEPLVDLMTHSNPMLYLVTDMWDDTDMPLSLVLGYLAAGLIMLILGGLAYERARLERVGDSMMYRLFEEIITWLIVFVGMTVFGFFFYGTMDSRSMMLTGMAVGTLLSFAVVKIIIARSIKIFTKQNLLSLVIFSLLALIFTGVVIFDLTGYGKWVPDAEDVASVERDAPYYQEYSYCNFEDGFADESRYLTSPEAVEKMVALHAYAAENYLQEDSYSDNYTGLTFFYEMKNGATRSRFYRVEQTETLTSLLNDVMSCEEYRSDASLSERITAENISYIHISTYDDQWEKYQQEYAVDVETATDQEAVITIDSQEEIADFLAALRKDDYNRIYTADPSGEVQSEIAAGGLTIYGTIFMKEGADGTKGPGTKADDISLYSSVSNYGTGTSATVDFNVTQQDTETLSLLHDMLAAEGYTEHAKLLEKYGIF